MGDILITAPAMEPITADQLRAELRDVADADSVLELLIKSAREYVEEATGIAMVSQVRELTLDSWPHSGDGFGWWDGVQDGAIIGKAARYVELPRTPLISIQSVTTFDTASNESIWPAANYFADTGTRPGRLALNDGATWPIATRSAAAIKIRYTAGHADANAVPAALARAVLQIAVHWYENRELTVIGTITAKIPMQAQRIISQFRIVKL